MNSPETKLPAADSPARSAPVPEPSFAPAVLALGIALLSWGFVLRGPVLALGLGVLLGGLFLWLYEDIRRFPPR